MRKEPGVFRKLKWRLKDLYNNIRKIPRWLKKSFQYSLVLWNDYDFDHIYILKLLRYKLKRTRERIEKDNILVATNRISKQIKYAEFLIDRIENNDYFPEEYKKLEEKWGAAEMVFTPCEDRPGFSKLDFVHEKCKTEEENEQAGDEFHAFYKRQDEESERDYDRLFRHLRKYIQRWWD